MASQKCYSLLAELDEMLKEVDSEGGISFAGGVGIDHTGNDLYVRRDAKPSSASGGLLSKLF